MAGSRGHSTGRPERAQGPGRGLTVRAGAALGGIGLAFLLLIGQLAHLQVARGQFYRRQAERQQIMSRELSARRGRIYDRRGRLLAVSVPRWSIYADPAGVENPGRVATALARLPGVSRRRVRRKLRRDGYFVWIKRQVSDEEASRVRALDLRGVHMRRERKRLHPQGPLAAHVVGFTDIDGRGLAGIERRMDKLLRGRPGMESVLCDGGRRIFRSPRDHVRRRPFNGYDVHLTLDAYIQSIAEQELRKAVDKHQPEAATALVLDARDCSVLAMASWPTFDPQQPAASPARNQRNMAVTDAYEYGSVMKPFTVAGALERDLVTPSTEFDCHGGEWRIGARTLHDAHEFGVLSVSDIICYSSNIGAAQVGMALGAGPLHGALRGFGFGTPSGIALPGEVGGRVRPLDAWNDYSVVSVAFGQELAVTPLSVARAFSVFPNDGALLQPRIIRSVVPAGGGRPVYEAGPPMLTGYPIDPATARQVMRMLRRVVEEEHGTGRQVEMREYSVAGKTGTAQLMRQDGRGYSDSRYLASFVGIAPVENSRVVVLVSLKAPSENGYYGGLAAGPAVRNIIRRTLRYLNVPPAPPADGEMGETA
ncbi:MAG: peptidoglycan D,D-transpeptidase FtsI family protein [Planctomycetota bacterium]